MPRLTQVPASSLDRFRLRACHALWIHFPEDSTIYQIGNSTVAGPTTPQIPKYLRFGLLRFRSPLLSQSRFLSFPPGTEMVHFPGFARTRLWIHRAVRGFYPRGFPHSEIPGSMPACGSPRLIAACHVLHRLLLPRHPPCALSSLTIKFTRHTAACSRRDEQLSTFQLSIVIPSEVEGPAFPFGKPTPQQNHHTPRKLYGPRSCSSHA